MPRLPPLEVLAGRSNPRFTSSRPATEWSVAWRLACRIRVARIRAGILGRKLVGTQEGIDHHIAHLSPSCASQTRRKRRHWLVRRALHVDSDVFECEGHAAWLRYPPAWSTVVGY